jgi:hypothetical protein
MFQVDRGPTDLGAAITVPGAFANLRFWRNTSVASLTPGQTATLTASSLGYEWNEDEDNGFRPAGEFELSSTSSSVSDLLLDYAVKTGPGTASHSLTLYRAPSGALVFSAGTVQWSWGLDGNHDDGASTPDPRMQQATVNLFADLGVQPGSLQSGLVAATASTDTTPPTSIITSPAPGALLVTGTPVTVTGTATDSGGGVVAGVEVSVDGGVTWHPASGRNNWSYVWYPNSLGTVTVKSRAVDDSGNVESPSAGVSVNLSGPISVLGSTSKPVSASDPDASAVELGVEFHADVSGFVTGVRFYKSAADTGVHVGNLWSGTGTLLATATFSSETTSGWQTVSFSNPVAIAAGTTYVASYHTNVGHYAADWFGFNRDVANGPLHLQANVSGSPNGVYLYGAGGFPTSNNGKATNYWVDVLFSPTAGDSTPPGVISQSPAPGATMIAPTTNVTATFSESVQASTIVFTLKDSSGNPVADTLGYDDSTHTATLTPSAALSLATTYTATVSGAKDLSGNLMTAPVVWSFTTVASGPFSVWGPTAAPLMADVNDNSAVGIRSRVEGVKRTERDRLPSKSRGGLGLVVESPENRIELRPRGTRGARPAGAVREANSPTS